METILTVNIGSASKKYALYKKDVRLFAAHFEHESDGYCLTTETDAKPPKTEDVSEKEFENAFAFVIDRLKELSLIKNEKDIAAIGIRIVAPGTYFVKNNRVTDDYLEKLSEVEEYAPLHIKPTRKEIETIRKEFSDIALIGISDSSFHCTLPKPARLYSVQKKDAEDADFYRFGYHGISIESILEKLKRRAGGVPEKFIVCHLGGGASITAIQSGKSIDTSMGVTPLSGLIMSTRAGEIDTGATLYFAKKTGKTLEELEEYLNTEGGLLGITETTGDIRKLLAGEKEGNNLSKLALDMFAYNVKKYIGAYSAALNGIDMLVLSGTIAERSNIMRTKICANLDQLGIKLDPERNKEVLHGDTDIHNEETSIPVAVVHTNEAAQIARDTHYFLSNKKN